MRKVLVGKLTMKFTIQRDELYNHLQRLQSVVEKKNTIEVLGNILFNAREGALSLSATDLEVGMKVTIPVDLQSDGKMTLSTKHLFEIIKKLPSAPLTFSKKENDRIEISLGKSKFTLLSLPAEEYPTLPIFEEKAYLTSRAQSLKEMIDLTSFAASTDATRYHLNGVFFEPQDNHLIRMTATDGHRLSFVDQEVFLKEVPHLKRGVIIPRKGLTEFRKLLEEANEDVGLAFDRNYVFAKINEYYFFVRLIEGEYPDYKQALPQKLDKTAVIPTHSFIDAVERVSLLAHEKSKAIKLQIQNGKLLITSNNPDLGSAEEEIEVTYNGENVEIGFNAKFLLDCLPSIKSETFEFTFKDRLSASKIQSVDKKNHTYIIMPMRI